MPFQKAKVVATHKEYRTDVVEKTVDWYETDLEKGYFTFREDGGTKIQRFAYLYRDVKVTPLEADPGPPSFTVKVVFDPEYADSIGSPTNVVEYTGVRDSEYDKTLFGPDRPGVRLNFLDGGGVLVALDNVTSVAARKDTK